MLWAVTEDVGAKGLACLDVLPAIYFWCGGVVLGVKAGRTGSKRSGVSSMMRGRNWTTKNNVEEAKRSDLRGLRES